MSVERSSLERLRVILSDATEDDVQFSREPERVHPGRQETKIAFTPVRVRGEEIPADVGTAYVEGQDVKGTFWYVISGGRNSREVISEEEAKWAVMTELRKWVDEQQRTDRTRDGK